MNLLFSILLVAVISALPGVLLALPARLASIKRLHHHSPGIVTAFSLALAYCSFVITFIGWTRWQVEVLYVFPVMSARHVYSAEAYADEIHKEAIVKELWQRAVVPPLASTCFTEHAIACDFADEFYETSLEEYLILLWMCLVPVVANQLLIRRWLSVETAVTQSNHAIQ